MVVLAILALAATSGLTGALVVAALRARRRDAQILGILATFGPVAERARADPRILLAWYPTVRAARHTFSEAFAALERDENARFPFSDTELEGAHARWTADWLDWEQSHDAAYRQKGAAIEAELDRATEGTAQALRTGLETLEREKLERYQRRYEEYVRVSRALANLSDGASRGESSVIGSGD